MNSQIASAPKALLVLLLVFSLLAPSLSTPIVYAIDDMDAPDPSDFDPVDNDNGNDNDPDNTAADQAKADEAAAEKAAADIRDAAGIAGVDVNIGVSVVYGDGAGTQVTMNGEIFTTDDAISLIGTIADAKDLGAISGLGDYFDVERTVSAFANGDLNAGEIVSTHGFVGSPEEVGREETDYEAKSSSVQSAAGLTAEEFSTRYDASVDTIDWSAYSGSMEEAYFSLSEEISNAAESKYYIATNDLSTVVTESLNTYDFNYTSGYLEYAASLQNAGISDLSGKQIDQNNVSAEDRFNNPFDAVREVNNDFFTGDVFFSPTPVGGTFTGDTQFGKDTLGKFVQLSPAQKQMLGEPVTNDDWTGQIKDYAADILASENANLARKIGLGEALTAEEQAEANAIISVAINRAAARGVSAADYFTDNIYSNWTIGSKDRLAELTRDYPDFDKTKIANYYESLFTGQTQTRSFTTTDLQEASPIGFATHYYNPKVATDSTQGEYYVPDTRVELGEHVFSQQYVRDRSGIEYQMRTTGLPDYITMVDVDPVTAEEVAAITGSGDFYTPTELETLIDSIRGGMSLVTNTVNPDGTTNFGTPDPSTRTFLNFSAVKVKQEEDEAVKLAEEKPELADDLVKQPFVGDPNKTRNLPISEELEKQLAYAAKKNGLEVIVTSGGQCAAGSCQRRVGSTRHDLGGAADVVLKDPATGELLSHRDAEDRARMQSFIQDAVTAGVNGVGAGSGYMTENTIHLGGGSVATWGQDKTSKTSEAWVNEAVSSGISQRENFDPNELPTVTSTSKETTADPNPTTDSTINNTPEITTKQVVTTVATVAGAVVAGELGAKVGSALSNLLVGDGINNLDLNINLDFLNRFQGDGTPVNSEFNESCDPTSDSNCPGYNQTNQEALVILSPFNLYSTSHFLMERLIAWITNSTDSPSVKETVIGTVTIPVTITVNVDTKTVTLSREDILNDLEQNKQYYLESMVERAALVELMSETPLAFDGDELVYSNGLYAPAMENGVLLETEVDYSYVYAVRYVDRNSNIIPAKSNSDVLSDDYLSKLIKVAIVSGDRFSIDEVARVTHSLIDPDTDLTGDEYYDYAINLTSGETRSTTIPKFASVSLMQRQFSDIGFNGLALDLVNISEEVPPREKGLDKLLNWAKNLIPEAVLGIFTSPENNTEQFINLPSSPETQPELLGLYIYTDTDIECTGGVDGFVYNALVSNPTDNSRSYHITDGRCGDGDRSSMVIEAIRHLQKQYGVSEDVADNVLLNTIFVTQKTHYEQNVYSLKLNDDNLDTDTGIADIDAPDGNNQTEYLPNLTNTIVFEIKVTDSNGAIISDWNSGESISINKNDQIYLRWDASDYQQCLPFLNDNGHYSLTRENQAMTRGNTESENYNLSEQTATYRIECGGQRNNEYGVDQRAVEVFVR